MQCMEWPHNESAGGREEGVWVQMHEPRIQREQSLIFPLLDIRANEKIRLRAMHGKLFNGLGQVSRAGCAFHSCQLLSSAQYTNHLFRV